MEAAPTDDAISLYKGRKLRSEAQDIKMDVASAWMVELLRSGAAKSPARRKGWALIAFHRHKQSDIRPFALMDGAEGRKAMIDAHQEVFGAVGIGRA